VAIAINDPAWTAKFVNSTLWAPNLTGGHRKSWDYVRLTTRKLDALQEETNAAKLTMGKAKGFHWIQKSLSKAAVALPLLRPWYQCFGYRWYPASPLATSSNPLIEGFGELCYMKMGLLWNSGNGVKFGNDLIRRPLTGKVSSLQLGHTISHHMTTGLGFQVKRTI